MLAGKMFWQKISLFQTIASKEQIEPLIANIRGDGTRTRLNWGGKVGMDISRY